MSDENMAEDFILKKTENHQRILDVGCGDAGLLIKIAKRNKSAELNCVDSEVEYARSNIEKGGYSHRIKCVDAKAERIPFKSHSFDFIYSLRSLHEFYDPVKVLGKIKRLLIPSGDIMIIDWKRGANTGVIERYYAEGEIKEFMKQAGYNVDNIKIEEVNRFNVVSYSETS